MSEHVSSTSRLVALGIISKTIGLKGACAVTPYGSTLERFSLPGELFVGGSESGCTRMVLEKVEFREKGPVCFFSGVTAVESAAKLCGLTLFIDQALLPQLEKGYCYHFDLMGLKVVTDRGRELGTVVAVHNFPTIDSVEVSPPAGEKVMIPLSEEALVNIDRRGGYLTFHHSFVEELL
ncbi:MAG: 16S rRNA processing protein RimM [Chitinispirillaceae bacterium]|nr:16S rRNA processing protein RimM [Chitinispirillaceae bacterium]